MPIWLNVNYGGVTGYYASYYDDSSYHSNEELTAKYGVPLCGASPPPVAAPAPAPASAPARAPAPAPGSSPGAAPNAGLVFTIVDADGGVYYRRSRLDQQAGDHARQLPGGPGHRQAAGLLEPVS